MDLLHHVTAGFKALQTAYSYQGLDELRQACGGAGYTTASRMVDLWADVASTVTLEGVNVIMFQQSSRFLIK